MELSQCLAGSLCPKRAAPDILFRCCHAGRQLPSALLARLALKAALPSTWLPERLVAMWCGIAAGTTAAVSSCQALLLCEGLWLLPHGAQHNLQLQGCICNAHDLHPSTAGLLAAAWDIFVACCLVQVWSSMKGSAGAEIIAWSTNLHSQHKATRTSPLIFTQLCTTAVHHSCVLPKLTQSQLCCRQVFSLRGQDAAGRACHPGGPGPARLGTGLQKSSWPGSEGRTHKGACPRTEAQTHGTCRWAEVGAPSLRNLGVIDLLAPLPCPLPHNSSGLPPATPPAQQEDHAAGIPNISLHDPLSYHDAWFEADDRPHLDCMNLQLERSTLPNDKPVLFPSLLK